MSIARGRPRAATGGPPARNLIRGRALIHVLGPLLCLVALLPITWGVITSFRPPGRLTDLGLSAPSLQHYTEALAAFPLWQLLFNTAVVALGVTAGQLLLSLLTAYAFRRFTFRGSGLVFVLLIGTILVPQQSLIVPNYLLAAELGWIDTYLGVAVPQIASLAFGVFLLRQHLRAFPVALFDAAEVDGAGHAQVLWRVVVPNLRPALTALAILFFVTSWNEYLWPLLITSRVETTTVQVGLQMFQTAEGTDWGVLMAAASLSMLPVLAAYTLAQRRIIDAFLRSGVS